ncbi:aspartate/glutamate racemase family protein [Bradyrhizobium sp. CCGUVB1N3]|uniref:aspartate/glutamate racemase family protein n=1 Tax=Bradyrhizobium sp. CCGUVB1N3 TaxID=2949629 RepID=UPI0020B4163B|nr:aspartate/glutamate racemase family protein [Bradyrhizobium sp. CCGUVB1N3]MCP3471917.1 aspartate/glutamate racemase family protein [Bradyrhizobium sp. CCGUVB1N3]
MTLRADDGHIVLINPNSAQSTTEMMLAIARNSAGENVSVIGVTATRAPAMIVSPQELESAADEVVELGLARRQSCLGFIVSAFGDPGLEALRRESQLPATGICEASMLAAHAGGRRFGVATVTPELADAIAARALHLGLAGFYSGIRCTPGDPRAIAAQPRRLNEELAEAVKACIERDGAEAVIIGGGPLGEAATHLQAFFAEPIIAPIPSAVRRLLGLIERH